MRFTAHGQKQPRGEARTRAGASLPSDRPNASSAPLRVGKGRLRFHSPPYLPCRKDWACGSFPRVAACGGIYGHDWLVDPARRLTVVSFTNTAVEGCTGAYPKAIGAAVYG